MIGVDIDIRAHNRQALESHELFPFLTLIQGSSIDPETVEKIKAQILPHETVLVLLDSNHTKEHVRAELEAYAGLVSSGSYIIVADGLMEDLHDTPRGLPGWKNDNPKAAAQEFLLAHPEFELNDPAWVFNESQLLKGVSHWPGAWLRKR